MPNMTDKSKPIRHIRVKFNSKNVDKILTLFERKSHNGIRSRLISNFSIAIMDTFSVSNKITLKLEFRVF